MHYNIVMESVMVVLMSASLLVNLGYASKTCGPGFKSAGETVSGDDSVFEYDSSTPLEITCILDPNMQNLIRNSTDSTKAKLPSQRIVFYKNAEQDVLRNYTTIINATAAQLRILNPPAGRNTFYCKLLLDDRLGDPPSLMSQTSMIEVCHKSVVVGSFESPTVVTVVNTTNSNAKPELYLGFTLRRIIAVVLVCICLILPMTVLYYGIKRSIINLRNREVLQPPPYNEVGYHLPYDEVFVVPPPPYDEVVVVPPPSDEVVVVPPPSDEVVVVPPPCDEVVVVPPPCDEVVVVPPPCDEVVVVPPPPLYSEVDVVPPHNEMVVEAPPSYYDIFPMTRDDQQDHHGELEEYEMDEM